MRIAEVVDYFYPFHGGIEVVARELAKEFAKQGHEVTVITSGPGPERVEGLKVIRKRIWFTALNQPVIPGLIWPLLFGKYDVYHTHYPKPVTNVLTAFIALIKRKKLVVSYQNDLVLGGFLGKILGAVFSATKEKLVFWKAHKIIATSQGYAERSKKLQKYKRKVVVIENAVNLEKFSPKGTKKDYKEFKGKTNLLFVGRLVPYKGVPELLRILEDREDFSLTIIGRGALDNSVGKQVKSPKLAGRVKWVKEGISDRELSEYYRGADYLVLPSITTQEGFGLTALEAMASGTPALVSDKTGVSKELKKKGLSKAVIDFKKISKNSLPKITEKELKEFIKHYSWKENARKTLEIMRE